MSYLKNLAEAGKKQKITKEIVKQSVKQTVKQDKPKIPKQPKQQHLSLNPTVKSIKDIPNVNIMTSGKLLGIRLRDKKEPMLKQLIKYITNLVEEK